MKRREFSLIASSFIVMAMVSVIFACKDKKDNKEKSSEDIVAEISPKEMAIPKDLKWSERMLLSEIKRFPEASKLDFREEPKWSYTNGLVLMAAKRVYEQTQKQKYYDYIYDYSDAMITDQGKIKTYELEKQNLDMLKSGDVLLYLYPKILI